MGPNRKVAILGHTMPTRLRPVLPLVLLAASFASPAATAETFDPGRSSGDTERAPGTAPDSPPPVEEGFLEGAGGLRLYYEIFGSSGSTVVAVHGGPGAGMQSFLPNLLPLAERHRVIFYDQRGGGRSGLPEDQAELDPSRFVADLEAVRRHFRIDRMNLLGHSFGALLVARYAQEHPERVARIALLGATGPERSAAAAARAQAEPTLEEREHAQRVREALKPLLEGTAEDPVAACRRYETLLEEAALDKGEPQGWKGSTCDAPAEAVAYYYAHTAQVVPRSFGDWDFTAGLEEVSAPVLVVTGDRASAAPEQQRAWADAYPNGRLLVVPGAGKAAVATHTDQVCPALATFFRGEFPEEAVPRADDLLDPAQLSS